MIVANVDYLAGVGAAARPPLRPGLIDRYLNAAARQAIGPVAGVNKVDLVDPEGAAAESGGSCTPGPRLGHTAAGGGPRGPACRLAGGVADAPGQGGRQGVTGSG